jgi:hypothetical protein
LENTELLADCETRLATINGVFHLDQALFNIAQETPIPAAELWPGHWPFEDDDLVPQRQNFQREFVPMSEQRPSVGQHHSEKFKHTTKVRWQIHANQSCQISALFPPPTGTGLTK